MTPLKSFQLTQHGGASAKIHSDISSLISPPCVNRCVDPLTSSTVNAPLTSTPSLSTLPGELRKLDKPNVLLSSSFPSGHHVLNCPNFPLDATYDTILDSHSLLSGSFNLSNAVFSGPSILPSIKIPTPSPFCNPLNLPFGPYYDPNIPGLFSELDPKVGHLVQDFLLCFVGVCSSTNNVATGVILTQYLQTLCDKPLYSYCNDAVLSLITKMTSIGLESHSGDGSGSSNHISDFFKLLIKNFSQAKSYTDSFGDICTLLTFAISTGLVDKVGPNLSIERINAMIKIIKPKQFGAKSPAELILNTVIGVATYIATLFGIKVNPVDDDYEVEFAKVIAMVDALAAGTFSEHFPDVSRKSIVQRISTLMGKYEKLVVEASSPMEKTMYSSKLQRLLIVKQRAINVVKNEQFVEQAFGLVIFGTSSIGKSHLVDMIAKAIAACNGFPIDPENIAVITPGDKYDTTITPSTTFCIFDDVATQKDFSLNDIVRLLIRFINNIPTPALKAGVEEKGTVTINPSLVIATTNVKDMQIPLLATNPIAPMRRLLYLTAVIMPEYASNNMLDSSKIPDGDMADTDVWLLKLERAVPCRERGFKFEIIEDNMRIGRCIKVLNDLSKAHFATQRRIVAQKYKSAKMVLCPCNSVLNLCRVCSPVEGPELESHSSTFGRGLANKIPKPGFVVNRAFDFMVRSPAIRVLSFGVLSTVGGREALCDYGNSYFVFSLVASCISFYLNEYLFGSFVAILAVILRLLLSRFLTYVDSYYSIVDFYADSVNYISIKTGIDSERLNIGLRYCTYGVAISFAIAIFRMYKTVKLDGQSKEYDHPDVVLIDEHKHNPWEEAELKARLPRDISMVVSGNPAVHLDQQKCFLRHLEANRIFVHCALEERDSTGVKMHRRFCGLRINNEHVLVNTHSLDGATTFKVAGFNTPMIIKPGTHMDFGSDLTLVHWTGGGAKRDLMQYFTDDVIPLGSNLTAHFPEGAVHTILDKLHTVKTGRANFGGYLYIAPSKPGFCGSAVTLSSRNFIVGLHAAGHPTSSVSACIPVTKTMLSDMVQKFSEGHYPMLRTLAIPEGSSFMSDGVTDTTPNFELHSSAISNFVPVGSSVQLYGCYKVGTPLGPRSSPSSLVPLLISDKVTRYRGPPKKAIPDLTGRAGKRALESTLNKWNTRPAGFSSVEFATAAKEMLTNWDGICLDSLRPVSDAQAINGIPTALYCPPINPNTSGGFPFPGTKMSHMFNNPDDDGRNRFSLNAFAQDKYDTFDNAIRHGLPFPVPILNTGVKDEPRDPTKFVRPITVFPMPVVIAFRKYFMMFSRLAAINLDKTGVSIGTNPYGPDFEAIHKRLFYEGAGIIAGDFSSYDTLISIDALMSVYGVIYELFVKSGNYSEEDLSAVRVLSSLSMNWYTVIDGLLVSVAGANSSGHPLTTLINCMVNQLFMICAFNRLKPSGSNIKYSDSIRYAYYGDDNLLSVGSSCKCFFNQLTLTNAFAEVGIKYTDANKSLSAKEFEEHADASFLKRIFKFHPDLKCVVGALDIEAIYDSLRFASRSSISPPRSEVMHTAELLDNAVMEIFYHGPDIYNFHYAIFEDLAKECGILNLVRFRKISYSERVSQWFEDYNRL